MTLITYLREVHWRKSLLVPYTRHRTIYEDLLYTFRGIIHICRSQSAQKIVMQSSCNLGNLSTWFIKNDLTSFNPPSSNCPTFHHETHRKPSNQSHIHVMSGDRAGNGFVKL